MKKIRLKIVKLRSNSDGAASFSLILSDESEQYLINIPNLGFAEAQNISLGMQENYPIRPLTHDLFQMFAESAGYVLKEVFINNVIKLAGETIYCAKITFENENKIIELDSRVSDSIALSVRFDAPIYCYEHFLEQNNILVYRK